MCIYCDVEHFYCIMSKINDYISIISNKRNADDDVISKPPKIKHSNTTTAKRVNLVASATIKKMILAYLLSLIEKMQKKIW